MMLNKTFYLLLLSLIPLLGFSQANSQYPDSGNKIRLGFQTSGDGLIWRDTQPKVAGYQPINNKAAWIVLDTVNNKFYHYKQSNNTWNLAGQDIDTANLIATKYNLGFKLSLADTQNMLTPYWRSGRFSGTLPVANGGTNASTFTEGSVVFAGTSGTYTQDNSGLFYDNTNDRLGIGTASPSDKLTVSGSIRLTSTLFANTQTNNTVLSSSDATNIANGFNLLGSSSYWGIRTLASGDLSLDVFNSFNPKSALYIANNGNVGIGTTSSASRFTIKGTTTAGERPFLDFLLNGFNNNLSALVPTEAYLRIQYNSGGGGGAAFRGMSKTTTLGATSLVFIGNSSVTSGKITVAPISFYGQRVVSNSDAAMNDDDLMITFANYYDGYAPTKQVYVMASGNVGIGRTPTTNALEVNGDASKTTVGSWAANSDSTIKTEIHTIEGALDRINKVRLVSFKYKDDYKFLNPSIKDKFYQNVIAQEFQKIYPDYVYQSGDIFEGKNILQVDTNPMYIDAVASIQELSILLQELQSQINILKQEIINLKNK